MSVTMDDSIKRWTAKRKTALVVEIIPGKTTVAEASRAYDLSPSEIEGWVLMPSGAWRMRFGRTRWRSASNTRSS
jgi:hypothetical protein